MAVYKMSREGIEYHIKKTQRVAIVFVIIIIVASSSILILKDREYDQSRFVSLAVFAGIIIGLFFYMRAKIKKSLTKSFESLEYEITHYSIIRRIPNMKALEIPLDKITTISTTKNKDIVVIAEDSNQKMAISQYIEDLDNLLMKLPEVKDF